MRLKERLGVSLDKEVAEALGMTREAFNSRKVRGSFPADKLRVLAAQRPDLKIDPDYVLTGVPGAGVEMPPPTPQAALGAVALMESAAAITGRAASRGIALDGRASLDLARVIAAAGQRSGGLSDDDFEAVVRSYLTGRGDQRGAA